VLGRFGTWSRDDVAQSFEERARTSVRSSRLGTRPLGLVTERHVIRTRDASRQRRQAPQETPTAMRSAAAKSDSDRFITQ
jgi:hypothetical protein